MKKVIVLLLGCLLLVGFSLSAQAATIVDTGTPTTAGGSSLSATQWMAGVFTLDQSYVITDVYGYIDTYTGYSCTIDIWTDNSGEPGAELFSQSFTINSYLAGWYGVSGVSWTLEAGTYWIVVEGTDPVSGGYAYMPTGAPNPLSSYTWSSDEGSTWWDSTSLPGFRVYGEPVPIPGAVWLFGSGLLGLLGWRRKFRS